MPVWSLRRTASHWCTAGAAERPLLQMACGSSFPCAQSMRDPIQSIFGYELGVTYYNLVSDQYTGLSGIVVPGTLRDSLSLLAIVLEQPTELHPTEIMTDTGAYTDVVFGLFNVLGRYSFSLPEAVSRGELRPLQNAFDAFEEIA